MAPLPLIKRLAVKVLHRFGYDVAPRQTSAPPEFLGLERLAIRSVLDIGANRGQFAARALNGFPGATVFCVEPTPTAFAELRRFAAGTGGRVVPLNVALGEATAQLEMFYHPKWDDTSSFLQPTAGIRRQYTAMHESVPLQVPVLRLDDLAATLQPPLVEPFLVKMDVQGYENRVIAGGPDTLGRAAACIVEVVFDAMYEGQATFRDVFLALDALGFTYVGNLEQVRGVQGGIAYIDAVFQRRRAEGG